MSTWKSSVAAISITLLALQNAPAQTPASPPNNPELTNRRMLVDPSSTGVSLGKATLTVSPLDYKEGKYVGDYQLKVRPYFFKSQKGPLMLSAPEDLVRNLSQGITVEFTGKATNNADGTIKIVKGKATPATDDKGSVTFSIVTDNGPMIFNTNYHLAR